MKTNIEKITVNDGTLYGKRIGFALVEMWTDEPRQEVDVYQLLDGSLVAYDEATGYYNFNIKLEDIDMAK